MANDKAIVLCSGGLNSAVTTAIAMQDCSVGLLHVRIGSRAQQREAECFEKLAGHFEPKGKLIVDMPHFVAIGGSARVSRRKTIEDALAIGEGPSNCYLPGMIGGLLHAAFTWAETAGARKIYLGISEDLGPPSPKTSKIYPDYARDCIQLYGHLFDTMTSGKPIQIETPLIDLNRMQIVKLGNRLAVPFESTWSCISSGTEACGGCVGCATRNRGFLDAALPDPLLMETARVP